MESKQSLDIFGELLVKNLRDKGIGNTETLLRNTSKAPSNLKLQTEMNHKKN